MALLTNLLSDGVTKGAKKALSKSVKKTTKEAISDAVSDTASKALSKSLRNEIADEVTDAAIKKMPKNLTGAGVSSLEKNAGSTLDGILGRSSGITLRNAKKPVSRSLADEYADTAFAKTAREELSEIAERNNKLIGELADDADNMWFTNRELSGAKVKDLYPKNTKFLYSNPETDVPAEYPEVGRMVKEGKLRAAHGTEEWGSGPNKTKNYELTGKPLDFNEKQGLLNAIKDQLPEDEAEALALEAEDLISPDQLRLIDQPGGSVDRKIDVDKITTRKKNIKVGRPEAMVAEAVEETAPAVENPALAEEIASLREKIGAKEPIAAGGMDLKALT